MGKCGCFFSARQLSFQSHSSGVRGLVVRCLPFNPEGSGSNPCVCANFFKQILRSRRFSLFRHYEIPPFFGFVRLFFKSFLMSPKDPSFNFFDIWQQSKCWKILKGPFFQIFRHYETAIKVSHFSKVFSRFHRVPLQFFEILQQNGC